MKATQNRLENQNALVTPEFWCPRVEICGGGETLKNRKPLKAYYDSNTQFA